MKVHWIFKNNMIWFYFMQDLWQRKETTQETLQGAFRKHGIKWFKFGFYLKFHNLLWRFICVILSAGIGLSQSTRRNCFNIFPAASQAKHCKKTLRDQHKFHDHFLENFLLVLYYFFTPCSIHKIATYHVIYLWSKDVCNSQKTSNDWTASRSQHIPKWCF